MIYNGFLIIEINGNYNAIGEVIKPSSLTTTHNVLVFDNEEDYLEKINELGLVIDELI